MPSTPTRIVINGDASAATAALLDAAIATAEATVASAEARLAKLIDQGVRNGAFTPGGPGPRGVEANNRDAYRVGLFGDLRRIRFAREDLAELRAAR